MASLTEHDSAHERTTHETTMEIIMFADNVTVQAENVATLEVLLDAMTGWASKYGMTWSTKTRKILRKAESAHNATLRLAVHYLESVNKTKNLGVTVIATGVNPNAHIHKVKQTMTLTHIIQRMGIRSGALTTNTMIRLWEGSIIPKTTYALYLAPKSTQLEETWRQLKKMMLISTMGCYSTRHRNRLLSIGKIQTMDQRRTKAMTSLSKRIAQRSIT